MYMCQFDSIRVCTDIWRVFRYVHLHHGQEHILLLLAGESISSGHVPTTPASHHVFPLVNKQANSLLDGLWWKLAYIWIDSSWILADDEDRWLLARETRTAHAPILLKTLQFFIAAGRRDGCRRSRLDLPMAPAGLLQAPAWWWGGNGPGSQVCGWPTEKGASGGGMRPPG